MEDLVTFRREGRVARIVLNRPEKLNALNDDMVRRLRSCLDDLDADDDLDIGVISGEGRAFCAGADVVQRQLRPIEEMKRFGGPSPRDAKTPWLMFHHVNNKPVVASIHGYVLGAGVLLALGCDYVVAADDTQFQITEIPRGLNGTVGWAFLRFRTTGAFADDVCVTGRYWSAAESIRHGLISHVVPRDELESSTETVVAQILSNPQLAVRAFVRQRRLRLEQIELEQRIASTPGLHLTADFRESALAFAEKRAAKPFEGR